jgi:peptide/nickel transport system substrate-binding protein
MVSLTVRPEDLGDALSSPLAKGEVMNIRHVRAPQAQSHRGRGRFYSWAAISAATALALGLATIVPQLGSEASATTSSSALTIAVPNVPPTLNPALNNNGGNDVTFTSLAYDSLIYLAPNGQYQPDLALSWKYVGSNNQEFVIQLRPDVEFSDGSTMTAQDVVNYINYAKTSGSGAAEFLSSLAATTATGPLTVQLNFSSPRPDLETVFDQNSLSGDIIGPTGLADATSLGTTTDGAGPYMIDASKTVTGSAYVFVPNPNYWNTSLVRYSSVTVNIITDPNAELDAVETGQDDFMFNGSSTQVSTATGDGLKVYASPFGWTALFIEDYAGKLVKALASEKVRQAINYATDRPVLTKALYGSYAQANDETELPGSTGYDPAYANYFKYNLKTAKTLMKEAGYPKGFTMTLVSTPAEDIEPETEALSSDLSAIGIKVKIHEDATFTEAVTDWLGKKYPGFVGTFGTLPMSIEAPLLWAKTALFNPFQNSLPTINSIINHADELDGAAADKLYEQAEVNALEEGYYDVIFDSDDIYFAKPGTIGNLQIGNSYPGSDFAPDAAFFSPPSS